MNGARSFFSADGSPSDEDPLKGGTTRARPVNVSTRLRQKLAAGAATSQDFFASLGIDATSGDRAGSSTSSSSNRSYNSMAARRAPASGVGSVTSTSSSSLWRPPTIGGLRMTPSSPSISAFGSLNVASSNRNVMTSTTSTSSITTNAKCEGSSGTGRTVKTATAATSVDAAKTSARPTQLFSMEDAEELYSDDGWDCDSPSTVLSNPTDETETTSTTVPVRAAVKVPGDEFAWGDDDDVFASPVAKATVVPPRPNEVSAGGASETKTKSTMHQAAPAAVDSKVAIKRSTTTEVPSHKAKSRFEQAQTVSAALRPPATMPSTAFSTTVTNNTLEPTGQSATQMSIHEPAPALERTQIQSTRPLPPSTTISSTFFPDKSARTAFGTTSYEAPSQTAPSVQTFVSRESYRQDEQWDDESDQQVPADTGSETMVTRDLMSVHTAAVTSVTTTRKVTSMTPPVELISPGGDAGEFWGDGEEDKLFDHDERGDEEWDESIEDQTKELKNLDLSLSDKKRHVESTTSSSFSQQDTSFSLPYQPPPLAIATNLEQSYSITQEAVSASNYFISGHSEEAKNSRRDEMSDKLSEVTKVSTTVSSIEPDPARPLTTQDSAVPLLSVENTHMTECSPFSSAIAQSASQESDLNVFLEAPPSARFLHTPTGTGGPFGRVRSPQGNNNLTFPEEISGAGVNETGHNSMTFASGAKGETCDSYTESNVRWDPRLLRDDRHARMSSDEQVNEDGDETRRNTHHGPRDEEERDSVVSFSGENSFFPSSGRPSSLYGGSQSSFASHRMYQSSIASTDHEGSSIASFGVSSAGATFGGSERVSEGGAFSDGTMSETPSMVDSSNASTAFGTDFPSVSEGQFSAPGTTIGTSDNASDGGFSDDNASETTSMCGSVHTNPRFLSEFRSPSGHCVTETVQHRGTPEPFALSAPESGSVSGSVATIGESATVAAAPIFGGDGAFSDANPFASSPSDVSSSQLASNAPHATVLADSSCDHRPEGTSQEDNVPSAAFLFDATAGSDVPNPFGSFGVSPAATEAKIIEGHELPTLDTGDLFGSGASSSGFESSFAQPYSSGYQTHGQNYKQAASGSESTTQTSSLNSAQSEVSFSNSNDRPAGDRFISSPFQSQRVSNYKHADPFASRDAQLRFDNSAPSPDSVFGSGGDSDKPSVDRGVSSYFDGDAQASADAATAANHFGQQSSIHSALHGGGEKYGHSVTAAYSEQASNHKHQSGANAETNTFRAQSHGQSGGVVAVEYSTTSGVSGPSSRQSLTNSFTSNATPRKASGFGGQNHFGRSAPGTPNNHTQYSAATAFSNASRAQQSYGSQQIGQSPALETRNDYSHHATAEVFGRASPAQSSYSELQDNSYPHYGQTASHSTAEGFGDHLQSSSSALTDAFFGRSSAADPLSSASDIGGERVTTPSSGPVKQQPPVRTGSQPSLLGSGSDASSFAERQGIHSTVHLTAIRPPMQSHDSNSSYGLVEDASLSRRGSNSSMSRYGSYASFQPQRNVQQQVNSTSGHPSADASSFFGMTPSLNSDEASSVFGRTVFQDSSEILTSHSQVSTSNDSSVHTAPQLASLHHQEHDLPQEQSPRETCGEYFGATTTAFPASAAEVVPRIDIQSSTGMPSARCGDSLQQHEANSTVGSPLVVKKADADAVENSISTIATENGVNHPQAFNGLSDSGSNAFGGETSSDFFSSSSAPQTTASLSYQFEHKEYGQKPEQPQHQVRDDAATSVQFAHSTLHHDEGGMHASGRHSGNYYYSRVPGADDVSSASHEQQQIQQQQQQYRSFQQQQQPELHHAVTAFGYSGDAVQRQPQGTDYNAASEYEYGTTTKYGGYEQTITQHISDAAPTSVVKTSNKYKDPCVAPPSCLASFGFGGNVVVMIPKKKLRTNIAGSSFRKSSRGAPVLSEFDNGGDAVLCKGPVNVYRMDQLHPKNSEFEQMDIFPGPLTEDVSGEVILECIDDHLKRSEATVEEENDRLLLGVLRVLVKCNGKLRSDPGMFNPSDPDSPEAQLIALLSESSRRRNRNEFPIFPLRKVQPGAPSDLLLKRANDIRELLLVGDRQGAVSSAMTAQMWPEAMLIASFTDKEEYRRVLRTYLDEHYATGDPCRTLFMSFADQQEKSVQEPKRLLQTNIQQPTGSLILSNWVSHAQVLLSNRTADTNKILTELGDRLWGEANAVAAAHTCYLLAGIQVDAPTLSSKMALLGGDHRTPAEARFYVSPGAVQRTEIYEWARKHAKGASANLMIPFQGYKLIYAMLLADHGKLDTAFKYVTSMLAVIKAVTAMMKPGTSMYLDGLKNQLTVLDDRLRQHLGHDRVASVAAATSRGSGRKQGGKWGLGSALSMMGKIVNRVVEGNESDAAPRVDPSALTSGGLYANEVTARAESYPSTPSMAAPTLSPASLHPQQYQQTPPPSSQGPLPVPTGINDHATPPVCSPNGRNSASATPPARPNSEPGVAPSGPFSGNGRRAQQLQPGPFAGQGHFTPQQQQQQTSSGPFSGNGRSGATVPFSNSGPGSQKNGTASLVRSQHSIEPPGSNHSTHSDSSFSGMTPQSAQLYSSQQQHRYQQQPPSSQTSQHSQGTPPARPSFQKSSSLGMLGNTSSSSQPKTSAAGPTAEIAASLPPTDASKSGPASDKGKTSGMKKPMSVKTPPPSGSAKGSGWLSGLSSFIVTKMNPEVKVAKLGEQMEAYFDEDAKRWVFPGESAPEEAARPSAPPTGPLSGSAPGSSATGVPPAGTNSAPGSIHSGPALSNDPLAALMAPPPSHLLMKKDPLAAMMAPPSRAGIYGVHRGGSAAKRKPPRPQFAVFKPTTAASLDEQSG
ncbi:unnamed protein product [Peronospora farinosa]|uniref:Protein transport protein sec16 n=1 Tax=Peronospora farinosa TaxID=134698 RepID=A0AAV0SVL4_9STRA|nr:unnamed protein product [Peronospora farinosa]CAI5709167.1 unnamed protein product [Peronospora farinosa]